MTPTAYRSNARPQAQRVVTVAAKAPGATYFVVAPNSEQLAALADAGIRPAIDSTFPLERAHEAFERVAMRGKRGKVVFEIGGAVAAGGSRGR